MKYISEAVSGKKMKIGREGLAGVCAAHNSAISTNQHGDPMVNTEGEERVR
jgi:hypothetical protein